MSADIKEVVSTLKSRLQIYMEKKGIVVDSNGKFICPAHTDTNPSASLNPATGFTTWKCFACCAGGSIYELYEAIEKVSIEGREFGRATRALMNEFEDLKDLQGGVANKEDICIINIKRMNHFILDLMIYGNYEDKFKHVQTRGWNNETAKELGIGSIPFIKIREAILEKFKINIEEDGIYKDFFPFYLFGPDKLTFTLYDAFNYPVGFSTRDMNWKKGDKYGKYINSRNLNGVFKKEKQVYNLANAINEVKKEGFIYLFEGMADVATAWNAGIKNVGAFCGTAITDQQFKTLASREIHRAIICTDSDAPGIAACRKHLEEFHYLKNNVSIEILSVPKAVLKEDCDPDAFIKKHGAEAFKKLERKSAFEWLLETFPEKTSKEDIVKEMIPHIALSDSNIGWQEKLNLLSKATGFEIEYIKEDVKAFKDKKENLVSHERSKILRDLYYETQDGGPDVKDKVISALNRIEQIENSKSGSKVSVEEHIEEVKEIFHEWKTFDPKAGLTGWKTGYDHFDFVFDGMPKHEAFIGLAALPHMGKSAFILNLIVKMLDQIDQGENKDLMIYFMTIDDAARPVLSRLLGILTGIWIKDIKKMTMLPQEQRSRIDQAMEKIKRWIADGRLFIADHSRTNNINEGMRIMKSWKAKYPNRHELMFLDNFHKLAGSSDAKERHKWAELSGTIQEQTVMNHFTCFSTLEFNKESFKKKRPSVSDIGESITINYDAQGLILGHCDTIANREAPKYFWYNPNDPTKTQLPVVELNVVKNKINTEQRVLYYGFDPRTTCMFEIRDIVDFQECENKKATNNQNLLIT